MQSISRARRTQGMGFSEEDGNPASFGVSLRGGDKVNSRQWGQFGVTGGHEGTSSKILSTEHLQANIFCMSLPEAGENLEDAFLRITAKSLALI